MVDNAYGVIATTEDQTHQYATDVITYKGFSLFANDIEIGRLQNYTPHAPARDISEVKELSRTTFGRPVTSVPAGDTNFELQFDRLEMWGKEVERALGETKLLPFLTDQKSPYTIKESYYRGSSTYMSWTYLGCWISSKGIASFAADGDAKVMANVTLHFVNKILST